MSLAQIVRVCLLVVMSSLLISAHPQPGVRKSLSCLDRPAPMSYHIHVMFWQNNANSTKAAEHLQDDFLKHFNMTRENNLCPFAPGDDAPDAAMCVFPTDYEAAGPFLTAQTALFIPISEYERTVSWTVQRRGTLDVFIHPNSGCGLEDHIHYGLWAGHKWEVDPSIFLD
jgi:aromatic ring-cleaving dioxygenase